MIRAIELATKLTEIDIFKNALFNEVPLPVFNLPWLHMNANKWCVLYRFFWLLGHSQNTESYQDASHRAQKASDFLIHCAKEHGSVLLTGHGIFNRLIAKCLNSLGWKRSVCQGYKYWGYSIFQPYKIISGESTK